MERTAAEVSAEGRQRVLVLYPANLTNVARVLRQIDFLASRYDVVVAAFDNPPGLPNVQLIRLEPSQSKLGSRLQSLGRSALRLGGGYSRAYWLDSRVRSWRSALETGLPVDAVVVNSLFALPVACDLGAPVVFDAHEHWTSESASWTKLQRLTMGGAHEWLVDRHLPRTAGTMTVSAGIVRDFERRTGVTPTLVTNAPFFEPLRPSPVGEQIRLLHVGLADERRRLEDTLDAVRALPQRFVLDLVLARNNSYRDRLERLAATDERIRILPPVPNAELTSFANRYDVGVFLLPAMFPNQVHVLPNKLFDYIQARLAVAIGPSPEMAAIVREWDCGVISETFTPASFAAALAPLTAAEVTRMKSNADKAAGVLNADNNRGLVLELVGRAVTDGRQPAAR